MTSRRKSTYEYQRKIAHRALARIGAGLVRDPDCGFYRIEQCPIRTGSDRKHSDPQLTFEFPEVRQL
jgi:hypothetical protein